MFLSQVEDEERKRGGGERRESCVERWEQAVTLGRVLLVQRGLEAGAAATLSSLLFSFCTGRQGTFLSRGGGLALHGLHLQLHT